MRRSLPSVPLRVILLLGGVALGVWQGTRLADRLWPDERGRGRGHGSAPARASSQQERRRAPSEVPAFPILGSTHGLPGPGDETGQAGVAGRVGSLAVDGGAGEPQSEEEQEAAAPLADRMRRLVRDIEFSAGLPEPLQQVVVEPPAPWRPDPSADARPPPVIEDVEPRAGPASGGARVLIRGRNLRAAQVMFGLDPARIVAAGPAAVTVVAPPARAGPVAIAVTNEDGSYAVAAVPFTYGK
jgi:hypothetical protein